jgi:hypothetical protein
MSFKDIVKGDLAAIMGANEFAEVHNIGGRNLAVIVDNDRLMRRSKVEYDGVIVGEVLFYVQASEYGPMPKVDEIIKYDGRLYQVFDVRDALGVYYEIILKANGV